METATTQKLQQAVKATLPVFTAQKIYITPLDQVTSPTIKTNEAAYYLNRKSQTLRAWACFEKGPIRPVRINGRLAWYVADILKLLNGGV